MLALTLLAIPLAVLLICLLARYENRHLEDSFEQRDRLGIRKGKRTR